MLRFLSVVLSCAVFQLSFIPHAHARARNAMEEELNSLANALQQADADAVLAEFDREVSLSTSRRDLRVQKITQRLQKRLPKAFSKLDREIEALSDSDAHDRLESLLTKLPRRENPTVDAILKRNSSDRQTLRELTRFSLNSSLPILAKEIARAGGALPFLLKAKKTVKQLQKMADSGPFQLDRQPAEQHWTAYATLALGALLGIFGAIFSWGVIGVLGGALFLVMTVAVVEDDDY